MAGKGPAPKDPSVRARRNKKPTTTVEVVPVPQPALSKVLGATNPLTGKRWRASSITFWKQLGAHPATKDHLPSQWSSLARAVAYDEAALLGLVPESSARLRLAKHFIDPDDMRRAGVVVEAPTGPQQDADKHAAQVGTQQPAAGEDPRLKLVQ